MIRKLDILEKHARCELDDPRADVVAAHQLQISVCQIGRKTAQLTFDNVKNRLRGVVRGSSDSIGPIGIYRKKC